MLLCVRHYNNNYYCIPLVHVNVLLFFASTNCGDKQEQRFDNIMVNSLPKKRKLLIGMWVGGGLSAPTTNSEVQDHFNLNKCANVDHQNNKYSHTNTYTHTYIHDSDKIQKKKQSNTQTKQKRGRDKHITSCTFN